MQTKSDEKMFIVALSTEGIRFVAVTGKDARQAAFKAYHKHGTVIADQVETVGQVISDLYKWEYVAYQVDSKKGKRLIRDYGLPLSDGVVDDNRLHSGYQPEEDEPSRIVPPDFP